MCSELLSMDNPTLFITALGLRLYFEYKNGRNILNEYSVSLPLLKILICIIPPFLETHRQEGYLHPLLGRFNLVTQEATQD